MHCNDDCVAIRTNTCKHVTRDNNKQIALVLCNAYMVRDVSHLLVLQQVFFILFFFHFLLQY